MLTNLSLHACKCSVLLFFSFYVFYFTTYLILPAHLSKCYKYPLFSDIFHFIHFSSRLVFGVFFFGFFFYSFCLLCFLPCSSILFFFFSDFIELSFCLSLQLTEISYNSFLKLLVDIKDIQLTLIKYSLGNFTLEQMQ